MRPILTKQCRNLHKMYNNYVQQKDSREAAENENWEIQTKKRMVGPG